ATLSRSARAAVPPGWIEATVQAAAQIGSRAARLAIGQGVATTATALARQSLRAMRWGGFKAVATMTLVLVAFGGIAWGVGLPGQDQAGPGPRPRMPGPQVKATERPVQATKPETPVDPESTITYQGRVFDPEGRPFAGAAVYLVSPVLKEPDYPP